MAHSVYQPIPARIFFGAGCIEGLAGETERLKLTRSVVVCSSSRAGVAEGLVSHFGPGRTFICAAALPNFPESAFDEVMQAIEESAADGLIAIGGGTPIGLGKAVAAATRLPFIAVPTTYSGSELASNWYVGSGDGKRRGKDVHALPTSIFYDPKLTIGLSSPTSAASGMNAMAHAVESLYGPDINPVVGVMAAEAIRLLGIALPGCADHPDDLDARTDALRGAWFAAGYRAGTGLSHTMAQRIRDAFDLDHARTHAVTLPYAVAFNAEAAPAAIDTIADALGVSDAAQGLYALNRRLGLPTGYRDLGMPRDGIDRAIDLLAATRIVNPRPAPRDQIRKVIEMAWRGDAPGYF